MVQLLEARNVEPGKQSLLGNGSVTFINGVTVRSNVLGVVHPEAILRGPVANTGVLRLH
jgi:hypothetical protein